MAISMFASLPLAAQYQEDDVNGPRWLLSYISGLQDKRGTKSLGAHIFYNGQ